MEKILDEKIIPNAQAKEILKARSKETDLGYEQKNTLTYLKKYDKLTEKKAQELKENLSQIKKLRDAEIIRIINILPEDKDDLRIVLEKEYNNLTEDEKKLILDNIKKII